MKNNAEQALLWITEIIKKHNIPFQIAGGLAARAYGATRELNDIDIDIPEENFAVIKQEVEPFITFGPAHFKSDLWDLYLMTLNYHGQGIDISGAYNSKIYNKQKRTWEKITTDFAKIACRTIYDLNLPVIAKEDLIAYKQILARPVDLIDIGQLTS